MPQEGVKICMSNALVKKPRRVTTQACNCNVKEKKFEILLRLQKAIRQLKEARKEIHTTVKLAMKLKENGDDIADQVIISVVEAITSYTNFSEFNIENEKNN